MGEKYKIGNISKLLGIPIQTLHYYEKCGFVTPGKDEQNHYRYYNAWDVNFLLDSKFLRSLQFTNAEIAQMIHQDSREEIAEKFDEQEKKLLDTVCYYQAVLDEMSVEKQRLAVVRDHLGTFEEVQSPRLLFSRYRLNNSYHMTDGKDSEIPQISGWLKHLPFVKATFVVPREHIRKDGCGRLAYWWGYSIAPQRAKELQVPTEDAEYLPACKSVYTVFKAYGENTFAPAFYSQVMQPILERGYTVAGSPVGRLLVRSHEEQQFTRFFEIWVPVEKTEP